MHINKNTALNYTHTQERELLGNGVGLTGSVLVVKIAHSNVAFSREHGACPDRRSSPAHLGHLDRDSLISSAMADAGVYGDDYDPFPENVSENDAWRNDLDHDSYIYAEKTNS